MYDPTSDRSPDRIGISEAFLGVIVIASVLALIATIIVALIFCPTWLWTLAVIGSTVVALIGIFFLAAFIANKIARHNISLAPGLSGDVLEDDFVALFPFCRTDISGTSGSISFVAEEYVWTNADNWKKVWDSPRRNRNQKQVDFDCTTDHADLGQAWQSFFADARLENEGNLAEFNKKRALRESLNNLAKSLIDPSVKTEDEPPSPPPPVSRDRRSLLSQ